MNTYQKSDGTRITKKVIDYRIKKAKAEVLDQQIRDYGYNFCEICRRSSGVILDLAHIVSVDECQKSGYAEKAYQVSNIEVLCRSCHQERDGLDLRY